MNLGVRHRSRLTLIAAAALWLALAGGVVAWLNHHDRAKPIKAHALARVKFSHVYPDEPSGYERSPVGARTPVVDQQHRVGHALQLASLSALATALPPRTLVPVGPHDWRLSVPVELQAGTRLDAVGPGRLVLAPGAFVVAESGASITLSNLTVRADWARSSAGVTRGEAGFIVARSGATLRLRRDLLIGLGHLGPQAYGVTLDGAAGTSRVQQCRIEHGYFGVYLARTHGVHVVGNRIDDSTVYGIDPHTYNSDLLIAHNEVQNSGVHGIILADHTSHSRVIVNDVVGARDHGIVLYQHSNYNTVSGNRVSDTFDGIVVTDSSGNTLSANVVNHVQRFGFRISGIADDNVFRANTVGPAIVGYYVYSGPTGNRILDTNYRADYEDVRIRNDAPGNTVTPVPPRSELG